MLYQLELQLFPYKSQGLLGGGGEREICTKTRGQEREGGAGDS